MHGGPPGLPSGPTGVRELFRIIGPVDQKWTIEEVIAEGDKVVVRATNTCEQENFLGIPARGRQQTFTATFIHRIADGKILGTWRNADDLGRVLQLGVSLEAIARLVDERHEHAIEQRAGADAPSVRVNLSAGRTAQRER